MPFAARLQQVASLTGGEDGAFDLIARLGKPRIRNAIAHGTIWLDSDMAKVHYTVGNRDKREYQMDLVEFACLAFSGSHLAEPYLAAISTIAVMEDGSELAKSLLPEHLARVFHFSNGET